MSKYNIWWYDTNGYDVYGHDRNGFNIKWIHKITKKKYDSDWYNKEGYNRRGYDKDWYDKNNFNIKWIHKITNTEYNQRGFNKNGFDKDWYDRKWYNKNGFDKFWFNKDWYDKKGFNIYWYHQNWFDREGFDMDWFNEEWIHKHTWTEYNEYGYNQYNFDENWFNKEWIHKNWTFYNENWYNIKWFDQEWYDEDWYDKDWYWRNGYNREWYWRNGYNREWYWRNGFNKAWLDKDGFDMEWYNKEGYDRNGFSKDGYNREWHNKRWFNKEWIHHTTNTKYDENWYDTFGYDCNWFNEDGYNQEGTSFQSHINQLLNFDKYIEANRLYFSRKIVYENFIDWETILEKYLWKYFKKYNILYPHTPSREQKAVITNLDKHLLVQARAGSGKTTTMIWKTHFLHHVLKIPTNEILFVAFNKKAVEDIKKSCQRKGFWEFQNACTFHSLAGKILNAFKMYENNEQEDIKRMSQIYQVINLLIGVNDENLTDEQKQNRKYFYDAIKYNDYADCERPDKIKEFTQSKEKNYKSKKKSIKYDSFYKTLAGDEVETREQKWIGDFLYEYGYKNNNKISRYGTFIRGYTPFNGDKEIFDERKFSFYIDMEQTENIQPNKQENNKINENQITEETDIFSEIWLFLSHFLGKSKDSRDEDEERDIFAEIGIDEHKFDGSKLYIDVCWDELGKYRKKWFDNHPEVGKYFWIPNNISDQYTKKWGRKQFEEYLKKELKEKFWFQNKKRDINDLYNSVSKESRSGIESMIENFINRAKQRRWSINEIKEKAENFIHITEVYSFYQFAINAYNIYETLLTQANRKDYNDILSLAIDTIEMREKLPSIWSGKKEEINTKKINLSQLKYLIVDEFQDVSELFYGLINVLRKYNPNMNIVCVWDDWQRINSFAWSQWKYIENFWQYFKHPTILPLNITHRCSQIITDKVDEFTSHSVKMQSVIHNSSDIITGSEIRKIYIENKPLNKLEFSRDRKYDLWKDKSTNWEAVKTIKYICEKFADRRNFGDWRNKKVLILSRTNKIEGMNIFDENDSNKNIVKTPLIEAIIKTYEEKRWKWKKFTHEKKKEARKILNKNIEMITAHKSKGMEADIVFIVGHGKDWCKIHPNTKFGIIFWDTESEALREEERLYYVAMTRAKHKIFFISHNHENPDISHPFSTSHQINNSTKINSPQNFSWNDFIKIEDIPF